MKRSSKALPRDGNQLAAEIVRLSIEEPSTDRVIRFPQRQRQKNPAAVALGKLGGRKGGKARAEKLSPEHRKAIAQRAAKARWAKAKEES
jgi:hypothetical protein